MQENRWAHVFVSSLLVASDEEGHRVDVEET